MNRKDFLKNGFFSIIKGGIKGYEAAKDVKGKLATSIKDEITDSLQLNSAKLEMNNPYQETEYESKVLSEKRTRFVRAPGALPEKQFWEKCNSSANCIKACPHNAIFSIYDYPPVGIVKRQMTPVIEPNLHACHLCQDYPCIRACQSGALSYGKVENALPYFGYAEINYEHCLRETKEEECKLCVAICPIEDAIFIDDTSSVDSIASVIVNKDNCIGCGLCIGDCPSFPKAIKVKLIKDNT